MTQVRVDVPAIKQELLKYSEFSAIFGSSDELSLIQYSEFSAIFGSSDELSLIQQSP
jgi:hypothetical protein